MVNELITKYKERIHQKIDGYKLTLEWAKGKNAPDIDIEVLTATIGTYQECIIELQTLELEENERKRGNKVC